MTRKEIQHAPGPWKLVGGIKGNTLQVYILAPDTTATNPRQFEIISLTDTHPIKEHLQRRLADMKLIALAPELESENAALRQQVKEMEELIDELSRPGTISGNESIESTE